MVLVVSMPFVSGGAPTSADAAGVPFAPSPWHIAHFAAKIGVPLAAVPLPGGRPVPSGRMLMSQGAMSASVMRTPSPGESAIAAPEMSARTASSSLYVDMLHLPLAVDRPAREAVVVLVGERERIRRLLRLAALSDEFGAQRLHVAAFVPRTALQDHRTAVPVPGHAEAGERLWQHRLLQRRLAPALAAVGGHQHLRDPALARVGDARNLVEAWAFQRETERGMRDERFHLLQEVKAVSLATRQDLRVGAALVVAHRRLVDELDPAQELDVHVALVAGEEEPHR